MIRIKNLVTLPHFVFLFAFACAIMWGSSFPIVKYGFTILEIQDSTAGKLYFASYRFFLAGIMLFFILIFSGNTIFLSKKMDYLYVTIVGFSQTTMLYAFFYIGLSNTTGVKAALITASGSFFLAIFSHFLFKCDKLSLRKIFGLILGFTGILIINVKGLTLTNNLKLTGEFFILFGAIASTVGNIMVKYTVVRITPPLLCAYQFTIGSIVLFSITLLLGGSPNIFKISCESVLITSILSVISAVAFSLWYLLIKYNPLSSIAIYRFLIPICGTFFSTLFIDDEKLTLMVLLSLLLVCSGIFIISKTSIKKSTNNFLKNQKLFQ